MAMTEKSERPDIYRIGMLGAVLCVLGIVTSGPLAVLVVVLVHPQPAWNGAALFVENFHRIQTLPFYFGFLLLTGSILMLASIYLLSKQRATALAALIFMSIGAAFAYLNYVAQTTFIPAVVNAYSAQLDPIVTVFSMANPSSLPWALEMWGYGFMGLGTWLAAGFFDTSRLERVAKSLFILNGIVSVLGALLVSIDLSSVFSTVGLVGYGAWNILYFALAVVFYQVLRKRRDSVKC
jgi:hypothetical protein